MSSLCGNKIFLSEQEIADEVTKLDAARIRLDAKLKASQAVNELWPGVFADPIHHTVQVDVRFSPELRGVRGSIVTVHVTRTHNVTGNVLETRSFPMETVPIHVPTHHPEFPRRNKLMLAITAHMHICR